VSIDPKFLKTGTNDYVVHRKMEERQRLYLVKWRKLFLEASQETDAWNVKSLQVSRKKLELTFGLYGEQGRFWVDYAVEERGWSWKEYWSLAVRGL
jgi:hypothetical protein